jgi:PiT family inorganic phosphate transporter
MGGLIGAALVKAGASSLVWKGILTTVAFIFISPLIGLFLGLLLEAPYTGSSALGAVTG